MRTRRIAVAALVTALGVPALVGCGTPSAGPVGSTESPRASPTASTEEDHLRIEFTVNGHRLHATLADSEASRDLMGQLPQTVEMTDHGGVEKTGRLRAPLSVDGQPSGADPDVGDLGYYTPGNDLVLYYGDQPYFPGIVILGKLEEDAVQAIAALAGPVTVTIRARSRR